MLVTSDTSPISNLAITDRLNLLRTQFGEIWIPGAVDNELGNLRHPSALASIRQALQEGWVKLCPVRGSRVVALLASGLDLGEAEAIALSVELSADWLLLDERAGRSVAEHAGIRVTGVLGILLRAKQRGQISVVKPELEALRRRARFFIASRLEEQILRSSGE
ncbi:putative nucleic acid-binding protein [Candidatus Sulfopaludibacter sp. SbA4]|nr:putative nucleic acid-binding protein [Candidatus Sulfopaludibacter sp. SbA4]